MVLIVLKGNLGGGGGERLVRPKVTKTTVWQRKFGGGEVHDDDLWGGGIIEALGYPPNKKKNRGVKKQTHQTSNKARRSNWKKEKKHKRTRSCKRSCLH